MLFPGDRCANLVFGSDGAAWQLYDAACGQAVLLLDGRNSETTGERARNAIEAAETLGAQVYMVLPADAGSISPDDMLVAIDTRGHGAKLLETDDGGRLAGVVLDANHRVVGAAPSAADLPKIVADLRAALDDAPTGTITAAAPVLFIPRVFEPGLCRELMEHFERAGYTESPMPGADGGAEAVNRAAKIRKDLNLDDGPLGQRVTQRLARRLLPEVEKAFCYRPTRFERPKLVRYDADDGGHFNLHRDNPSPGTAYRRFAVSLNLNTDYAGGHLVFPEYDARGYVPEAGCALVFGCSHAHGVMPVTAGQRYALITFLYHTAQDAQDQGSQKSR